MNKDCNLLFFLTKMYNKELMYSNGKLFRKLNDGSYKECGRNNTKGYKQITGTLNKKEVTITAHRLIYAYFNNLTELDPELEINHKDGNKQNNNISNLELITPSENQKHAYDLGLKKRAFGERNQTSKLTDSQVIVIKELILSGSSNKEIATKFGTSHQHINLIRKGKKWSWLTGFSQERSINREEE